MKALFFLLLTSLAVSAQYYKTESIPLPEGEIVEISSLALLPDKKVAIAGRRGDVWVGTGCYDDDLSKVRWSKFADGLLEPFGMHWRDGSLYVIQRDEYTQITDKDGDGKADQFTTICDDWGYSGNYHEFAFGSDPDAEGNVWVTLCLSSSRRTHADWRGWGMRISPDGKMHPEVSGIRSPGGVGMNSAGDFFYTDNQGTWNGSSSLKWLKPGSFAGNPTGNVTAKKYGLPEPPNPKSGSRLHIEREKDDRILPPAVILPHALVGQSPTAVLTDTSDGKFGPFAGQLLIGENTHSELQRVDLEKVNGIYQGAVFEMIDNYASGVVPVKLADDGTLFVGGTFRGWGSRGSQPFALERTRWTGKTPFEIKTMRITPEGFRLTFTKPVDPESAADPESYTMRAWTYIYQESYGSPSVDRSTPKVTKIDVAADGLSAELTVEGRVQGHVHELKAEKLKSAKGESLWHAMAHYTLNEFPKK